MVIDNGGRDDEGCIGDLITLEAATAGLGGILVWGRHRDSAELRRIGLPLFSLGACSTGPRRLDDREDMVRIEIETAFASALKNIHAYVSAAADAPEPQFAVGP